MRLNEQVAIVTGGGSGIGAAICRAFAAEGAAVAVLDVDAQAAERVAGQLDRAMAVACDVTDSGAVDDAFDAVMSAHGRLDVLVNNAGIAGSDEVDVTMQRVLVQLGEAASGRVATALDPTRRLTDEQWRRMLATHLDGTFYCSRAALRHMGPAGSGAIVNISSIFGIEGGQMGPHYSAAKGGILAFTRSLAKDAIIQGVRVNAIAPGFIDTPLLEALPEPVKGVLEVTTPGGRLGTPEEVAATAVFLASDEASWFVGQTLSPNGGAVTV